MGGAFYIDCLPMLKNGGGATAPLAPPVPPPMAYSQELPKIFRAPICRSHPAVIFATAQLSCFTFVAYSFVANFVRYISA